MPNLLILVVANLISLTIGLFIGIAVLKRATANFMGGLFGGLTQSAQKGQNPLVVLVSALAERFGLDPELVSAGLQVALPFIQTLQTGAQQPAKGQTWA